MASIFTTPRSQALRFIDKSKINDVQNYDNRFVYDLQYAKTLPYYYVQQFEQTDSLWLQYRTDYTNSIVTVSLVDENNIKTTLSKSNIYTDSSSRTYYNVTVPISDKEGCYFIEIESPGDVVSPAFIIQSEVFTVSETVEDSIFVKWFGNEPYDDQMHWTNLNQGIRINGRDRELTPDQNKSVYDDSSYAPLTLKSKPIRKALIEIDTAPYWLIEKINLGLSHTDFYIQDVKYNTDSVVETEQLGDLLIKKATLELTQVDFEDGDDSLISGGITQSFILFNDSGDKMLFNDLGDYAKANN